MKFAFARWNHIDDIHWNFQLDILKIIMSPSIMLSMDEALKKLFVFMHIYITFQRRRRRRRLIVYTLLPSLSYLPIQQPTTSSSSSSSSLLAQDAISNANCKEAVAPAPQSIVVALRIRPLTASEHKQGCKDCIGVIPGEPQVYIICISNPNHM